MVMSLYIYLFCVEEYEKLKAQVSDKDMQIAKLTKEKLQLKELLSVRNISSFTDVHEKLKAQMSGKDMQIAKLTKEKLQLKELLSMRSISTDAQYDYWTKAG